MDVLPIAISNTGRPTKEQLPSTRESSRGDPRAGLGNPRDCSFFFVLLLFFVLFFIMHNAPARARNYITIALGKSVAEYG